MNGNSAASSERTNAEAISQTMRSAACHSAGERHRGARSDFETRCLPYLSLLRGTAMRLTQQSDDASDLVQETLLRAYVAWPRFEQSSNCRAWLLRILNNSFINAYRKRQRHSRFARQCPHDTVRAVYGDVKRHIANPESLLIANALDDEVTRALASLGDDQRKVIEMADLRGVRYRDIAETLGLPLGTVMSRLSRGRRKLERQLSEFAASNYGIQRAA
ncbi:MAG: sigma-70 family RNA polymerase sigma factor [Proteobacteria bacterium]|nr:sigma-70 family RNA polymerase sigma factor [Pseudomonadota bacterium]